MSVAPRFLAALAAAAVITTSAPIEGASTVPPPPLPAFEGDVVVGPRPGPVTWSSFRGTPVVVELFATWCAPCWGGLAQWDRWASGWSDEEMVFLLVSNEDEQLLRQRLLDRWTPASWVVRDRSEMTERLIPCGLPLVLLLDRRGELKAAIHPSALIDEVLRRHAAGEPVGLDSCRLPASRKAAGRKEPPPSPWLRIRPTKIHPRSYVQSAGSNHLRIDGLPIKDLLPYVFETSPHRILIAGELPEPRLELEVRAPQEILFTVARQGLLRTFGLSAREEDRRLPVFVLRPGPERKARKLPAAAKTGLQAVGEGRIGEGRITAGELAIRLEAVLDRPVVDETGEQEAFAAETVWESDPAEIFEQVQDALGLELVPTRREIAVVVVGSDSSSPSPGAKP